MTKLFFALILLSITISGFASSRVEDCLNDDRNARLEEINEIILKINQTEVELHNFQFELSKIEANSSKLDHEIFMRNTAGVIAAVGFAATLIYQKKHVTPRGFMLVGGYTLTALSAIVMAIENNGVRLNQKEINDLKASIAKLEKLITLEKKKLEKEIGFLAS